MIYRSVLSNNLLRHKVYLLKHQLSSAFDLDTVESYCKFKYHEIKLLVDGCSRGYFVVPFLSLQEHRFLFLHSYEKLPIVF